MLVNDIDRQRNAIISVAGDAQLMMFSVLIAASEVCRSME